MSTAIATRTALVLAAASLGVPAAAAAQAVTEVEVTHESAVVGAFDACSGEEVFGGEGQVTRVERTVTDASGGEHTASIGTAVSASSDGVIINHQADAGPTNFTASGTTTNTDTIQILVIEPGAGDNAILHDNIHTTLDANGEVVSNPVNVFARCQG